MDNLFDDPNMTGDIEAPNALKKPQQPTSRSRAGPIRRSAMDGIRQRAQNGALARDTDQHKSAPVSAMARVEAAVTKSAEVTKRVALAGACVIGLALLLPELRTRTDCAAGAIRTGPPHKAGYRRHTGCGFRQVDGGLRGYRRTRQRQSPCQGSYLYRHAHGDYPKSQAQITISV